MDQNTQITKEQVREAFRTGKSGAEISKVVGDYFRAHFKKIIPVQTEVMQSVVDAPRASVDYREVSALGLGL